MFGRRMKNCLKLLGFEVKIDASWLVIAVLVTWSLAKGAFPAWYPNLSPETYWIMGWWGPWGSLSLSWPMVLPLPGAGSSACPWGITLSFSGVAEMGMNRLRQGPNS